jgi:hypothetical protein
MKRKGFLLALGLVLATNLVVFAGVAYNRGGTPDARLTLTARELPLAWTFGEHPDSSENTGLSLQISWQRNGEAEAKLLTRAKLEALGFEFPAGDKPDWAHHKDLLDRKAYVVLEYDGEAWTALLKQRAAALAEAQAKAKDDVARQHRQREHEHFANTASRLVPVDAGLDAATLRARYADGAKYLIAKARIAAYPSYRDPQRPSDEYDIHGRVAELLPDTLYVPRQFHALVQQPGQARPGFGWQADPDYATPLPDYQITLAYGRRHEPWIEAVAVKPAAR